jgi:F-type H+-transporting ATPase subunit delta
LNGSRISKRYAKALFSLGQEDGNFDQYGRDLIEFAEFCQQQEDFRRIIANPVFAVEDRKRILRAVLEKSSFSDMVKNFLYLLLEKDRIGNLESITEHYTKLTDDISNIARAEIITARPLKEEALERIEKSLERLTSKKIKSEVKQDQELIGGVVVKIGDMVLDGSVKAQIEGLKESY